MKIMHLESATRFLALGSVTGGILSVTLLPAHADLFAGNAGRHPFSLSDFLSNARYADVMDVAQNVILFLPFGFFFATVLPIRLSENRRRAWTCAAGLCVSAGVEILQAWIPGRYSALSDVLLNGCGAFLGGVLAARLARNGYGPDD